MRQALCWLVGGALCLGLDSMSMAAESGCRAEFVTADISARSEQLLAWLKAHPPADDWNSEWRQNDSESVLFADIDNDGKEEAIVLSHGGTLHTAGIDVFRPSADGWKGVPLPPGPAFPEEDIWYDWQNVDLFDNPPPVDHGAADGPAQVENGRPGRACWRASAARPTSTWRRASIPIPTRRPTSGKATAPARSARRPGSRR